VANLENLPMNKMITSLMGAAVIAVATTAHALSFSTAVAPVKQSPDHGHLAWNGEVANFISIPADGTYRVTVRAAGMLAAGIGPDMALRVNESTRQTVRLNHTDWRNYTFDVKLNDGVHRIGVAFTNDETINGQDRNLLLDTITISPVQGGGEPAFTTANAYAAGAQQRDADVLAATNALIAEHRKAPAQVIVVDSKGNPVSGASVEVRQTASEFLFGANLNCFNVYGTTAENNAYKQHFSDLLNYATVPMYWAYIEPVKNNPNYAFLDAIVNWGNSKGLQMKGHAVLYGEAGMVPAWAGNPTQQTQLDRISAIFNRYGSSIKNWDLVNEPVSAPVNFDFTTAYQHARNLRPDANLIVNEYGQLYSGFDIFYANAYQTLRQVMQQKLAAGAPIDVIGLQAHEPLDTAWPLETVWAHLNLYGELGPDIHITEFSPCSNGNPVLGTPYRGTWTEATQAQFAEDFYRVCFAHPKVKAISWWDLSDNGAWLPGGGMLRANLTPKPVYDRLKNLIHNEWRTNVNGTSNAQGRYLVDAFHGKYSVKVTINGVAHNTTLTVTEEGDNVVTVTVPASGSAPADTTAPVITLNGAASMTINVGSNFTDPGASATDNKDGNLTPAITVSGSVNRLVVGTYTLTYNVKDAAGNAATPVVRTVNVVDTVKPVITLTGASTINVRRNKTFTDPGATATDNYYGNLTSSIVKTGTVDTSRIGTYKLYYNVTDGSGNKATQVVRTVNVTLL
jgi:GH35 family endo-1,4-beta-xylanase